MLTFVSGSAMNAVAILTPTSFDLIIALRENTES